MIWRSSPDRLSDAASSHTASWIALSNSIWAPRRAVWGEGVHFVEQLHRPLQLRWIFKLGGQGRIFPAFRFGQARQTGGFDRLGMAHLKRPATDQDKLLGK